MGVRPFEITPIAFALSVAIQVEKREARTKRPRLTKAKVRKINARMAGK